MFRRKHTLSTLQLVMLFGVVFVLDGVVERMSVILGRRVQDRIDTGVREYQITLENVPEDVANAVDFGYLLVRFGTNEHLSQGPSPEEKAKMKLRNREFDVEQSYDRMDRSLTLNIPVRTHRKLATEFKLFADVRDPQLVDEATLTLEDNDICADVSESDSSHSGRLYVLVDSLETTTTPEGFVNNVVYSR